MYSQIPSLSNQCTEYAATIWGCFLNCLSAICFDRVKFNSSSLYPPMVAGLKAARTFGRARMCHGEGICPPRVYEVFKPEQPEAIRGGR
jgi:hypothetical protein